LSFSSHSQAPEERLPYPEKTGGISPPRSPPRPCFSACQQPGHGARHTVHFFLSVSLFCSSSQSSYKDHKEQEKDQRTARKSDLTGQIISLPLPESRGCRSDPQDREDQGHDGDPADDPCRCAPRKIGIQNASRQQDQRGSRAAA